MALIDIDRAEIIVPGVEKDRKGNPIIWPTLGPQVIRFIEDHFVFGPGPLKGEPYRLRNEFKYLIMRAYEHYPAGTIQKFGEHAFHMDGRRRFQKVAVSLPKGSAKSELMAILALTELHPDAPIRFDGYDPTAVGGLAPGRSIVSPYIPMLAPTVEQVKDLAYGAAQEIAKLIDDSYLFDPTDRRILIVGERDSKIIPIAASPSAADGAKTTFQCIDEPHRLILDRQIATYETMQNNLPKRYADDPWQLTTSTAGNPNEMSVALMEFEQGMRIYKGLEKDPGMLFYHRGTTDANAKFDTMEERLTALKEASGPEAAGFRDLLTVAKKWDDPSADPAYLERVWCNRWVKAAKSAFDVDKFRKLGDPGLFIPPGSTVVLGFDGSISDDSTALVMTEVETGIQNIVGLWERPENVKVWTVPVGEVDACLKDIVANYDLRYLFGDPPHWQSLLSKWEGEYGPIIVEWPTRNETNMYYAIRVFEQAIDSGELAHNGDPRFIRHVAAAGKNMLGKFDAEGLEKFRLIKIAKGRKFDAAVAAILSWQARLRVLAEGPTEPVGEDYMMFKVR